MERECAVWQGQTVGVSACSYLSSASHWIFLVFPQCQTNMIKTLGIHQKTKLTFILTEPDFYHVNEIIPLIKDSHGKWVHRNAPVNSVSQTKCTDLPAMEKCLILIGPWCWGQSDINFSWGGRYESITVKSLGPFIKAVFLYHSHYPPKQCLCFFPFCHFSFRQRIWILS